MRVRGAHHGGVLVHGGDPHRRHRAAALRSHALARRRQRQGHRRQLPESEVELVLHFVTWPSVCFQQHG